ncbi:WD40 repeat-like protein [Westerdykella ornata]|uniref:WD40 repeat-like protein n=1 Tax=Westerdykella ornata TaxID=318751 RepID=A0A6A6JL07_WESOR|nr:WD40 repeat-like protein [Westerdykella ornata]KAF2276376.1 WD40 repeat-like protein [Westerdykella ornata]
MGSRKPKKPPPITPKRFTRFFTPRNSRRMPSGTKSSRKLQDITRSAINRAPHGTHRKTTTPRKTVNFADVPSEKVQTPQLSSRKRRAAAAYLSPVSSPLQSSPSKRPRHVTPPPADFLEDELPIIEEPPHYPTPIRRLRTSGGPSRTLQRSFGGLLGTGRGFIRDHCVAPHDYTADFYSSSHDFHQLPQGAPPFCTASCNTNSMVAVGDEDGWLHLLDADEDTDFTKATLSFRAHTNAIMDVQFSSDDMYIATGSGDQTAQILDARTQQCVHILAKHKSSVKQVRFQPGDDRIVATSSRDGAVQIWDLRCKGGNTSIHSAWGRDAPYASSIRTLAAAHADSAFQHASNSLSTSFKGNHNSSSSSTSKPDALSRRGDISVTALSFLPDGRQHLLLTASDASTCVKLWDIRGRYSLRGPALPISTTKHPESHTRHRHFAINSLTLNSDASRLYALSKDNTVYAYSTAHLILGFAPELSLAHSASQKYYGNTDPGRVREGLGPLYGFRHANFHAGSFYVKASLRRASGAHAEMLAVGSTDGCPVLFPTDENLLRRERGRSHLNGEEDGEDDPNDDDDGLPLLVPANTKASNTRNRISTRQSLSSISGSSTRASTNTASSSSFLTDTIPIYSHVGTPLIRGHEAEVTSVTWALNGTLVSVGDDCKVRHWKEGAAMARELRGCGEGEGRRWMAGWAAVERREDEDD